MAFPSVRYSVVSRDSASLSDEKLRKAYDAESLEDVQLVEPAPSPSQSRSKDDLWFCGASCSRF